jgi:hypothetical protein
MTTPQTGDRRFDKTVVRIADLSLTTDTIEDYQFSHCRIIGPAILGLLEEVTISGCTFISPGLEAMFWEVPPDRGEVIGIVGVRRCVFSGCTFEAIGIAGPPSLKPLIAEAFPKG